jgi:heavy metal sensor kinase
MQTMQQGGGDWRVLSARLGSLDGTPVIVQVGYPQDVVEGALARLVLLMALAIPATLAFAVYGGMFLAGRALNPIDHVTRTAARIGAEEDLSQRLNLGGEDEVVRLARSFDHMLDRLERAFARQRQFTADASHELRTPLALFRGQIEVALNQRRSAKEYQAILASLHEDAERMTLLLGDLLTLARADAGQENLIRERIDLADVADEVVAVMQPLAEKKAVVLLREPGASAPVEGDQTRLLQLLVNLVDNAVKYTPAGGRVAVLVDRHADQARLRVADTGVGIAPENLPHLFERFYRVDKARARAEGGFGLGLAIVEWIVKAHGGRITVESQADRGTTFTVTVPLAVARLPRPAAPSTDPADTVRRDPRPVGSTAA